MRGIQTSIFELLKTGPGPSSSHTIAPMRAGYDFLQRLRAYPPNKLRNATQVKVVLFGALAATGKGHRTDIAALAGLAGNQPETCPPNTLDKISPTTGIKIRIHNWEYRLRPGAVVFDAKRRNLPHANTMSIALMAGNEPLFTQEYYSTGGGFIHWTGRHSLRKGAPIFPFSTASQTQALLVRHRMSLPELILKNEMAITGKNEVEIFAELDRLLDVMDQSVTRGIKTNGVLPGKIRLHRKAPIIYRRASALASAPDRFIARMNAYAFAAAEENAAGHVVVTAPTCGSCGVLPALARVTRTRRGISKKILREALMAAAWVGFLAKHNASIAGAEVGCQGEIGVASSMGAAFLAQATGCNGKIVENAAETALEHHLGMTCDPVGGYVQIPCIERNAMGAIKAYSAHLIALAGMPDRHLIGLDKAIKAMAVTGRDMADKYKETAKGGLAEFC